MSSVIKTFNNQIYNLVNTLSNRFPEDKDIKLALTVTETLKSTNPKKSLEIFLLYAYKYRDVIMAEKESFFLEKDYLNSNSEEIKKKFSINLIQNLKDNWTKLESIEKENIWKYLKVLIKLTDKYLKDNLDISKLEN
jgi:hypothetical protein